MNTLLFDKKTRKKKRRVWLFVFISLCSLFVCSIFSFSTAFAAEETVLDATYDAELETNIKEQLHKLDFAALEAYLNSLNDGGNKSVEERIYEYIKGADFNYREFGIGLLNVFFERVISLLPAFAVIASVCLLSGLISTLKSGTNSVTSSEIIFLVTYAAALIPTVSVLLECFQTAREGISSMRKQMQIVYPLLLTLMAASGSSVTAAVCRPAVGFFSNTIVSVIDGVVIPLTVTIMALSMAGNLTKQLKISRFSGFFKSINKWIIGICVSVFGIFFTLQGITSANYDGVVRRAAKYAIGNGIPIIGGFLSGGFDLAVAGSVLIKNSLGSMSIFLMLSVLLEPLILLVSVNVLLRLVSAITQPFGDSRISDFLGETAENLQYCTAGLLFTAFMYFLSVVLMIYATEALF